MYWFYHPFNNLHFGHSPNNNDSPIPTSSIYLCFKCLFEMQVVELIVSPPYEYDVAGQYHIDDDDSFDFAPFARATSAFSMAIGDTICIIYVYISLYIYISLSLSLSIYIYIYICIHTYTQYVYNDEHTTN